MTDRYELRDKDNGNLKASLSKRVALEIINSIGGVWKTVNYKNKTTANVFTVAGDMSITMGIAYESDAVILCIWGGDEISLKI